MNATDSTATTNCSAHVGVGGPCGNEVALRLASGETVITATMTPDQAEAIAGKLTDAATIARTAGRCGPHLRMSGQSRAVHRPSQLAVRGREERTRGSSGEGALCEQRKPAGQRATYCALCGRGPCGQQQQKGQQ